MALIAMLMGTPFNAGAQTIIPKSRFSARNVPPQVKEHNVLALFCLMKYGGKVSYPYGTPLYYQTGNSRGIIKTNGYKMVSKFGETTKGDLAWTRECSYENGRLKNIRYSDGDVDIYEYDNDGRIVRVTRYNSNGDCKYKVEFSAYSRRFCYSGTDFNRMEFEIKDDGYYFNTDEYHMNLGSFDRSYGTSTYRFKHIVNMQSGYVERIFYWRYEELTMKGRLAGKKYDWHYSDSDRLRFDPECCFFPGDKYIVEYEEVL